MKFASVILIFSLAIGFSSISWPAEKAKTSNNLSTAKFVQEAALSDMFEVEASKLALQRASQEQVRFFAQHMIDEHSKDLTKLSRITESYKVNAAIPSALDQTYKQKIFHLQKSSGPKFDQDYLDLMMKNHQTALSMHQDYARSGDNVILQQYAMEAVVLIQEHLTKISQLIKS